jgi:hypothetical protein
VVVDNINPTPADRAPLIAIGRARGAEVVGYYFAGSVAESLARNRLRTGRQRVPEVAIFAAAKRLQPPTLAEGFDRLYRVRAAAEAPEAGEARFEVRPEAGTTVFR